VTVFFLVLISPCASPPVTAPFFQRAKRRGGPTSGVSLKFQFNPPNIRG